MLDPSDSVESSGMSHARQIILASRKIKIPDGALLYDYGSWSFHGNEFGSIRVMPMTFRAITSIPAAHPRPVHKEDLLYALYCDQTDFPDHETISVMLSKSRHDGIFAAMGIHIYSRNKLIRCEFLAPVARQRQVAA